MHLIIPKKRTRRQNIESQEQQCIISYKNKQEADRVVAMNQTTRS